MKRKNILLLVMLSVFGLPSAQAQRSVEAPHNEPYEEVVPQVRKVDLGLSSGLLWADRNVGADSPEANGRYFAWGETESKAYYSWGTYFDSNEKYNASGALTRLLAEDDAATVTYGEDWRMPTREEAEELMRECRWVWTTLNGKEGYQVTGPSGNSIFFPYAQFFDGGKPTENDKFKFAVWTSSQVTDFSDGAAYCLYGNQEDVYVDIHSKSFGQNVRGVTLSREPVVNPDPEIQPSTPYYLVAKHEDGNNVVFSLGQRPRVSYKGEYVTFSCGHSELQYRFAAIKTIQYMETAPDGIRRLQDEAQPMPFSTSGGSITFRADGKAQDVRIVGAGGDMKRRFTVGKGESVSISLTELPKGVYVISVNGVSYKFSRR